MARGADGVRRQRPLGRQLPATRNARYLYTVEAWRDLFASGGVEVRKKHDAGAADRARAERGPPADRARRRRRAGDDAEALAALLKGWRRTATTTAAARTSCSARSVRALMAPAGSAPDLLALRARARGGRRPHRRRLRRLVRAVPALAERRPGRHGTFDDVIARAALCPRPGLRRALLPADPPDRPHESQGPQQQPEGAARTIRAAPMPSARPKAGTTRSIPSSARSTISRRLVAAAARATASRSRSTSPSSARPTIPGSRSTRSGSTGARTARIKYAENPPKKYEDIVNVHFYRRCASRRSGSRCATSCCSGSAGRQDLPGRQSAHQAVPVLGVADPRGPGPASRRDLPRRGVHAAEDDAAPGQARLHPVLHLLHVAQHQAGADRVSDRADADEAARVHAAELLRQHAGYQPAFPADQRPAGLPDPPRARGHARAATTASTTASSCARRRRSRARRNISTREKYRDQGLGLGPARATSATTSRSSTASGARTRRC